MEEKNGSLQLYMPLSGELNISIKSFSYTCNGGKSGRGRDYFIVLDGEGTVEGRLCETTCSQVILKAKICLFPIQIGQLVLSNLAS